MPLRTGRILILVLIAIFLALFTFIIALYSGAWGELPKSEDLRKQRNASATLVLSDKELLVGRFFMENRTNITWEQVPAHLKEALVATEDRRFYSHRGFDTRSFLRVIIRSVLLNERSSGGGSTISQQLAKNIYGRSAGGLLSLPANKARETIIARRIENTYSKKEILLLYLNTVPFGENLFGVEAAANRFFNKRTAELKTEEAAVLVGMLKANTSYNPRLYPKRSVSRRNTVLMLMAREGYIGQQEADSLAGLPLQLDYSVSPGSNNGYFLVQVKAEARKILAEYEKKFNVTYNLDTDGLTIGTTLDLDLQDNINLAFREHLSRMQQLLDRQYQTPSGRRSMESILEREIARSGLRERADERSLQRVFSWEGPYSDSLSIADSIRHALGVLHAGMLAMDPASGAVKAYAGGIDYSGNPYDQIRARRQLASAFKPLLFAAALESGIEPCRYLDNDSVIISDYPAYSPVNYDRSYGGRWSLPGALAHSMNIPAFNLFLLTGYDPVASLWKDLGFRAEISNVPSLALGAVEANIMEVAVAYSAFANGGFRTEPYTVEYIKDPDGKLIYHRRGHSGFDEVTDAETGNTNSLQGTGLLTGYRKDGSELPERVISEETSLMIRYMMEKAVTEGTASSLANIYGVSLPLAAKTGTAQNYSDAWFAAFGPDIVMVSRVGASNPAIGFTTGRHGSASALALPLAGITLKMVQGDQNMAGRYFPRGFEPMHPELLKMADCPDHVEKRRIERFFDLFKSSEVTFSDQEKQEEKREGSWFRRVFRSLRD